MKEKIQYVGHSMGTTTFMVMNSLDQSWADKVELAVLLAPIGYVEHMASPIKYLVPFLGVIDVSSILTLFRRCLRLASDKRPTLAGKSSLQGEEGKMETSIKSEFYFQWIVENLGIGEFLPSNWLMDWLAAFVCDVHNPLGNNTLQSGVWTHHFHETNQKPFILA